MTKSKIEMAIDEALGIADKITSDDEQKQPDDFIPISEVEIEYIEPDVDDADLDPDADMKLAVAYLKSMMKRGYTAIDQSMKLAISTQHPRVYEIIADLMKQTTSVTKELVNLHATNNKSLATVPNQQPTQNKDGSVTNNTIVFTGTPQELQQMLREGMVINQNQEKEIKESIEHDK